ncbi:MAG TPA: carbonic anhydrase [Steroidobacteraceae bacterium]|nr:carbonic anhydrase [Steroidobacteraceae bacterium]
MTTRRTFLLTGAAMLAAPAYADDQLCAVYTKDRQTALDPSGALQRLKDGNARFVGGRSLHCDLMAQVRATAKAQAPFAAVVGCIDSRVPPELVFDQQIGDIFCARIAGSFVNTDIIGSLEFATKLAGAKAILVLGHSECGAIKGAIDDVKLGNLTAMLANIRPAVVKVTALKGPHTSKDAAFVQAVGEQNTRDAAALLLSRSSVLQELVASGNLAVAAAMHDLATGVVTWLA